MYLQPFKYDYLTNHVKVKRIDRFTYLMEKVGYNGIVRSVIDDLNPAHTQHITDTGILFITGKDAQGRIGVITGYFLTINKAKAIYKDERMPYFLYKTILRNMREHASQFGE